MNHIVIIILSILNPKSYICSLLCLNSFSPQATLDICDTVNIYKGIILIKGSMPTPSLPQPGLTNVVILINWYSPDRVCRGHWMPVLNHTLCAMYWGRKAAVTHWLVTCQYHRFTRLLKGFGYVHWMNKRSQYMHVGYIWQCLEYNPYPGYLKPGKFPTWNETNTQKSHTRIMIR